MSGPLLGLALTLGFFLGFLSMVQADQTTPLKPNLLLLQTYSKQPLAGWVMSEKLDGVRAYWDGHQLMSRNGRVFAAPDFFTKGFPSFELDGELWLSRGAFAQTASIVNRQQPHSGWRALTFQVFEVPNQFGDLVARLAILQGYLENNPNEYLKIINQQPIVSSEQVEAELQRVVALGGEGLVVRDPTERYRTGRSSSALKLKVKEDAECRVTDYTEGRGKYRGQVGALMCVIADQQFTHLKGARARTIKVGSGLSDAERRVPPEVGSLVTFQYMGLTKNGLPRFPVFLRVRKEGKEGGEQD